MAGQGVDAGGHRDGGPASGELLQDLEVDLVGLASAAVLLGIDQAEQPGPAEGGEQSLGVALGPFVLLDARGEFLVGDLPGEGDEIRGFGGGKQSVDVHGDS